MSTPYQSQASVAHRALPYVVSVTGAAPGAPPSLASDGVDVTELGSVIVRVTVDPATAGGVVEVTPWLYGQTRTGAGAAATPGWLALPPRRVDAVAGGELGQELRISTEGGDRLYLQVAPSSAAVAWANAEAFQGLRRCETVPTTVSGLHDVLAAAWADVHHRDYALLADVTNGNDDTYYYYVDCAEARTTDGFSFTLNGGSGTVTCTIEATLQDDGTLPAACQYGDVTLQVTGLPAVTVSSVYVVRDLLNVARYLRVKVVANTAGAHDADWRIISVRA